MRGTGGPGDPGIIRLDFPTDGPDPSLEEITWDEWFRAFDANQLAFVLLGNCPSSWVLRHRFGVRSAAELGKGASR